MSNFVKLYSSILDSSIWFEPDHVLRVWLALLALSDPRGMVEASPLGLQKRSNVASDDLFADAIRRLEGPDPHSKTPDHEGRRIERVKGGWFIFNYRAYRERNTSTERVRAHRERVKGESVTSETRGNSSSPSSSVVELPKEGEEKRDVTHETRGNGVLAIGELVQRIRGLATKKPQGGFVIPMPAVEALGSDVARAYRAVGGTERFLGATGKDFSFLVREFGDALRAVRAQA